MTLSAAVQTTVGASAVKIANANPNRRAIVIQNVTANAMRFATTNAVTATTGIRVAANETVRFEHPVCPTEEIWAIRDAGADATACVAEISKTP